MLPCCSPPCSCAAMVLGACSKQLTCDFIARLARIALLQPVTIALLPQWLQSHIALSRQRHVMQTSHLPTCDTDFQTGLADFDPDRDLDRIGLANQTTMLKNETLDIGKMLEKTMMQVGPWCCACCAHRAGDIQADLHWLAVPVSLPEPSLSHASTYNACSNALPLMCIRCPHFQQGCGLRPVCAVQRYGVADRENRYMVMDTICDATQERQSAVYDMVLGGEKPDMMIVVGGFNSSNTSHLQARRPGACLCSAPPVVRC